MSDLGRLPLWGVFLLAASTMILESCLTRLLAVAQFYHFAFLAISLALLGFGASGTILGFLQVRAERAMESGEGIKVRRLLILAGIGFFFSTGLAYLIINFLPFDSYSIAWDRRQILLFFLYFLVLTCPFLFAGLGIGAALSGHLKQSYLVYAANLFGSAVGVIFTPLFMWLAGVPGTIMMSGILVLLVVLVCGGQFVEKIQPALVLCMVVLLVSFSIFTGMNLLNKSPLGLSLSPYKGLSYALRIPGATRIYGRWNAISRIDVISGAATRVLPGMSYTFSGHLPEQFGMAIDGDSLLPIPIYHTDQIKVGDYLPEAIAFRLRPGADILVLEPHGGMAVLQALAGGARRISAVISNPNEIQAVNHSVPGKSVFEESSVEIVSEAPRVFLNSISNRYTLILVPLTDPYRPVGSGAYSLTEAYLYTVESFRDMLLRLSDDGVMVVSRWLQTPPSEEIKILATLLEALERIGASEPGKALFAFRSIQTITVLLQPRGWNAEELRILRDFLEERKYDLVWAPDVRIQEVNRFNILPEPYYYREFREFITAVDRSEYYSQYPFYVKPATDDHPFFYNFFKWRQTPQVLSMVGHTWQPFGGSGYLVLIALLFLVITMSIFLIGLPLIWSRFYMLRKNKSTGVTPGVDQPASTWRLILYFGGIGLGYLLVEIPLIQRAILWFGNPMNAFTIIVTILLVSSGLGSYYSRKVRFPLWTIVGGLSGMVILVTFMTNLLNDFLLSVPIILRVILVITIIAPLGFMMGFPFPAGMRILVSSGKEAAALAWAINGCASVISAVMAAIMALEFGFNIVLLLGASSYCLVIPGLLRHRSIHLSNVRQ